MEHGINPLLFSQFFPFEVLFPLKPLLPRDALFPDEILFPARELPSLALNLSFLGASLLPLKKSPTLEHFLETHNVHKRFVV